MKYFIEPNKKYNNITTVNRYGTERNRIIWECICDCGNLYYVSTTDLGSGHTKSCGCSRINDLSNKSFGRLVAEKIVDKNERGEMVWLCLCECGTRVKVKSNLLVCGDTKSCGCLNNDKRKSRSGANCHFYKHGEHGTKEYYRNNTAKRRASILNRTTKWSDLSEIREFYKNCPKGYHVDHIVPLQGKNVSGLHVLSNLQYLTKTENLKKNNYYESI